MASLKRFSFHNWYQRMTRLLEGWNLEDGNRWREWLLEDWNWRRDWLLEGWREWLLEEGLRWKWLLYNGNLRWRMFLKDKLPFFIELCRLCLQLFNWTCAQRDAEECYVSEKQFTKKITNLEFSCLFSGFLNSLCIAVAEAYSKQAQPETQKGPLENKTGLH
ncbi:unnamed protein product [Prunus armeniaca]